MANIASFVLSIFGKLHCTDLNVVHDANKYRCHTYISRIHSAHHRILVYIDMNIDSPGQHTRRRFCTVVLYMGLEVLQINGNFFVAKICRTIELNNDHAVQRQLLRFLIGYAVKVSSRYDRISTS